MIIVTGASFVVFNGSLKSNSELMAKSSIVEDGLMIQILPETMLSLKQALEKMEDHVITCGAVGSTNPETVFIQWVDKDKDVNHG